MQDDTLRPSGRGASPCARMSTPGCAVCVIYDSIGTSGAPSRAPPGAHLWLLLATVAISWLRRLRLE